MPHAAQALSAQERKVYEWLCRTYVQRADHRQITMGLQYTTAETSDLAREFVRAMVSGKFSLPLLPSHLQENAKFLVCSFCNRKEWALDKAGERCAMPQPAGHRCGGVLEIRAK